MTTVDVWLIDTDTWDRGSAWHRLDADERHRAQRFLRPVDRSRFVVAHAALREVLGQHVGVPAHALRLTRRPCPSCGEPHGKPALDLPLAPEFNLSHSGRLVTVAIGGDRQVGVDVQEVTSVDHDTLARRFFSRGERHDVTSLPQSRAAERFHQLWARKEAVLKATGEGITADLAAVDTREGNDGRVIVTRPPHHSIVVRDLDVPNGYHAAVAAPADDWSLQSRWSGAGKVRGIEA
jgi:4'-phosphopantetheinyl transferase